MANRRMTSSDIFEDDFICTFDFFERLVWIGLFVACADDQGRLIDSPAIVRAKVFPYDKNVDDSLVEFPLIKLAKAGKIFRYQSNGKQLIQITKWWQYQTPTWATPSRFPSPKGWIDRYRYHAAGNKILTNNWDKQGGFISELKPLDSDVDSTLDSGLKEEERRGEDVKEEGESKGDVDVAPIGGDNDSLISFFESITQLEAPRNADDWLISLQSMKNKGYTPDIMKQAVKELSEKKTYKIVAPKSIETACSIIYSQRLRDHVLLSSEGEYAEYITH